MDRASTLEEHLARQGITRRDFLKFCSAITATLVLPLRYVPRVANVLAAVQRPPLVWLEFQDCAGCSEALLRISRPTVADLVLNTLSVNYHETIMAPAGKAAVKLLDDTVTQNQGKYLVVVEGSIPTKENGIYCTVGGRTALDIATRVCKNAAATITVGACAFYGGWPNAAPNPTGAVGVKDAVPGITLLNLPGCPPNAANISATVVHYLTFGTLPAADQFGRPLFAYGTRIHDNCERRAHFDAGEFVEEWGDEGHRKGWCLYKMGCKGPATFHNCPTVRYNDGVSWPVGSGHGCVGCSEIAFWETMTPFYQRIPNVAGFGVEAEADKIGVGIVGGVAAAFAAHGVISALRARRQPIASHEADGINAEFPEGKES
jgi:hydrogenase small subunit